MESYIVGENGSGEIYCAAYAKKIAFFFFFKVMIKITGVNLELHSHTCTCSVDTEEIFQIGSFISCKVNTRRVNCLIYGTQYEPVMECIYEEGKCKYRELWGHLFQRALL